MEITLDLQKFAENLRDAEECRELEQERSNVNSYLLEVVLPLLEQGLYPFLTSIDFDQFDMDDPPVLQHYINSLEGYSYALERLNGRICNQMPISAKQRVFL